MQQCILGGGKENVIIQAVPKQTFGAQKASGAASSG